jgi:hypothetical protein
LESGQDIETRFVIEIAETDFTVAAETLMDEVECWAGPGIRRPASLPGRDRQAIDRFQVECDQVGYLSKCKFSVGAKGDITGKDRAYLGVYTEEEKLRIKRSARPNPDARTFRSISPSSFLTEGGGLASLGAGFCPA